jgi:hypothetical protein
MLNELEHIEYLRKCAQERIDSITYDENGFLNDHKRGRIQELRWLLDILPSTEDK